MSQSRYNAHHLAELAHRLKTRLALANFKRQYGYEKYDLYTLESSLFQTTRPRRRSARTATSSPPRRHRYYPLPSSSPSPPPKPMMIPRALQFSPSIIRSPLSAKRNTPPRRRLLATTLPASPASSTLTLSSDAEDAANLLVMLHNMI